MSRGFIESLSQFATSDAVARFAEFERVEWSNDGWRAQLLEKAIGGDVDALIVAGVIRLGQRSDSRQALDALAKVTANKDGKRRKMRARRSAR